MTPAAPCLQRRSLPPTLNATRLKDSLCLRDRGRHRWRPGFGPPHAPYQSGPPASELVNSPWS